MFDLEQAIKNWKKSLYKNRSLEDGYIEELEQHLRDEIENNSAKGLSEEETFGKAVKIVGDIKTIDAEYHKTNTTNKISGRVPDQAPRWMPIFLWSNLKATSRFLVKNRSYLLVSMLCLIIGFASFILSGLFIFDELNYDSFHSNPDGIYRVIETDKNENSKTIEVAQVAYQIGPAAKETIPGVEDATRLFVIGRMTIGNDLSNRDYERIWIPDENFFSFFNFDLILGNPETALKEPNSIVLTESTAKKYFGRTDVIGERLYTNLFDVTITGVMEDFPKNSHIAMEMLVSEQSFANKWDDWSEFYNNDWDSNGIITYLKLHPSANPEIISTKIKELVIQNTDDPKEKLDEYSLQSLSDIHLYSAEIEEDLNVGKSNSFYVYMFGIIGSLILLIACFNYMNLNISSAMKRTKEIALRKVIGAGHKQVISQFTTEALLLSVFSLIVAIALTYFLIPVVNDFLDKDISFSSFGLELFISIAVMIIITTVMSTIYPAVFMFKIKPADALQSRIKIDDGKINFRKILVLLQFGVSFAMIFSTITIYSQLEFMRNKNLGFKLNDLLVMDINSDNLRDSYNAFKSEILSLDEVKSVCATNRVPGEWKVIPHTNVSKPGNTGQSEMIFLAADEDFLTTYDIKLLQGRNFLRNKNDSGYVMINSLAAKALGLDNPIGTPLQISTVRFGGEVVELDERFDVNVIGVVDEFYFESFRKEKKPIIISYYKNPIQNIDYYTYRLQTSNWGSTFLKIKEINRKFDPENPVEYNFLNDRFSAFYETDRKQAQLFMGFSVISILIACLGLFALISFAIEKRVKEIGIRKVLGASEKDIFKLVSFSFAITVIIGCAFAAPFAYMWMNSWLQEFAYRISISWEVFALSLLCAFIIAFSTISYKILNAARMNPVDSIRNE